MEEGYIQVKGRLTLRDMYDIRRGIESLGTADMVLRQGSEAFHLSNLSTTNFHNFVAELDPKEEVLVDISANPRVSQEGLEYAVERQFKGLHTKGWNGTQYQEFQYHIRVCTDGELEPLNPRAYTYQQ